MPGYKPLMISHEHRCIFVHIPRAGGSSVEQWLCGADWWTIEPSTKHLTASQAKALYSEWWDDYFKFSIVRDPYSRAASLLTYADFFGLKPGPAGTTDWRGYYDRFGKFRFGEEVITEHDHRFHWPRDVSRPWHEPGAVYCNILDQPLDFIGHLETLPADMRHVAAKLGVTKPFDNWVERSPRKRVLTASDAIEIEAMYARDFERFGYARQRLRLGMYFG